MSQNSENEKISQQRHKTSIGGQAVMEGVMMRGPQLSAMAVRDVNGEIQVEQYKTAKPSVWYKKTPFVRGIFNFVDMLISGYKCLMRSVELSGMEDTEEPSKFEKKLIDLFGDKLFSVISFVATILGVGIAFLLFLVVPAWIGKLLGKVISSGPVLSLVEGLIKIAVFIVYLALVSRMKEIHRLFQYHGAEHKTIACYEAGEELIPENVKKYTRFHPRCGTSFLLIVLIISIIVSSFVTWSNLYLRVALKILLIPVVVGIAYEIIKLVGRHDNIVTRCISAPGLCLQRLTTQEPDESQMEVAIASMLPVIPEDQTQDRW